MTTMTPEQKAKKRAERLLKEREELRQEMRRDVEALRKLIHGKLKKVV